MSEAEPGGPDFRTLAEELGVVDDFAASGTGLAAAEVEDAVESALDAATTEELPSRCQGMPDDAADAVRAYAETGAGSLTTLVLNHYDETAEELRSAVSRGEDAVHLALTPSGPSQTDGRRPIEHPAGSTLAQRTSLAYY